MPSYRPHVEPTPLPWKHSHVHGDHEHIHTHPYTLDGGHEHGWHSPVASCGGDDTFGEEEGPRLPSGLVRHQLDVLPPGSVVVRPFVPGMLRYEGDTWGYPINVSASQYDYWDLLMCLSERGDDFVVLEQDNVAPDGALQALFDCPEPWCGHAYNVAQGNVVEVFGDLGTLGLTAFKGPAVKWLGVVLSGWAPVTWSRLDGMVYRAMRIQRQRSEAANDFEQFSIHRHYPDAGHLHDYSRTVPLPSLIPQLPSPENQGRMLALVLDNTSPRS